MRLAVQRDLQFRVQIIRIGGVTAEEADEFVVLVYMLVKDGIALRHGKVPRRVHLERAGAHIVVDPEDAFGEFSVDLLKFRRTGIRLGKLLNDESAGLPLVVHKHTRLLYPLFRVFFIIAGICAVASGIFPDFVI